METALGLDPRVKGFVKRGKNDAVDAEAICEAVTRPSMRFVPVKRPAQQALMVSHRLHDMLMRQRTMLINPLRSQMAEFGLVAAKGRQGVATLVALLDDAAETRLPAPARAMLKELVATLDGLAPHIRSTETAIVAWLGLVPKQNGTGGKMRLGRISKMGDRYLRKLLVLGATSGRGRARRAGDPLALWTRTLAECRPARLVSVALANKTARIIWAVMARGEDYRPELAAA